MKPFILILSFLFYSTHLLADSSRSYFDLEFATLESDGAFGNGDKYDGVRLKAEFSADLDNTFLFGGLLYGQEDDTSTSCSSTGSGWICYGSEEYQELGISFGLGRHLNIMDQSNTSIGIKLDYYYQEIEGFTNDEISFADLVLHVSQNLKMNEWINLKASFNIMQNIYDDFEEDTYERNNDNFFEIEAIFMLIDEAGFKIGYSTGNESEFSLGARLTF